MLVKDLIAQGTLHQTIDLLEGMMDATSPKRRRDDVHVRAYVVGSFWRKRPVKNEKVINIKTIRRRKELRRKADELLKKGA